MSEDAPPLYRLPFSLSAIVAWFVGETMTQATISENIILNDVVQNVRGLETGGGNYVAKIGETVGLLYPYQNNPAVSLVGLPSIEQFTLIACFAQKLGGTYISALSNSHAEGVSIGRYPYIHHPSFPSDPIPQMAIDDALHIYHVVVDTNHATFYLDGVSVGQKAALDVLQPLTFDMCLYDSDEEYFLSDLILVSGAATREEISDSYAAIATYRGLI